MRISVYSLSLRGLSPAEIVPLCRRYACDGIEWWCREDGHLDRNRLSASSAELASLMKDSGMAVAGIAPYFTYDESRDTIAPLCEAAAALGTREIRCHSYPYDGTVPAAQLRQRQRRWLEEIVVPVVQEFNVRLNIEQHHGMICATPDACRALVDGLPRAHIGIIYDPGNSLNEGYTSPAYALDVIGPYLAHVHVKSAAQGAGKPPAGRRHPLAYGPLASGDLDWPLIVSLLASRGYGGFLSLEDLDGRVPEQKMADDIPYLQTIVRSAKKGGCDGAHRGSR